MLLISISMHSGDNFKLIPQFGFDKRGKMAKATGGSEIQSSYACSTLLKRER